MFSFSLGHSERLVVTVIDDQHTPQWPWGSWLQDVERLLMPDIWPITWDVCINHPKSLPRMGKTTYHLLQDFFSHHKHPLGLHGRLWKLETSAQFQLSTWLLFRMLWMDAVATWSVQLLGGRFGMQFKSHWKGDHEMMGSLLRRSSATGA